MYKGNNSHFPSNITNAYKLIYGNLKLNHFSELDTKQTFTLTPLTNLTHSLPLNTCNETLEIDIANSYLFGSVYLFDQMIKRFSQSTAVHGEDMSLEERQALEFLPTLITALEDDTTKPTTPLPILKRRYFSFIDTDFNTEDLRKYLFLYSDLIPTVFTSVDALKIPTKNSNYTEKLTAWTGCDWGDALTEPEVDGQQNIANLAQYFKEYITEQVGSSWEWIHEQLRDLYVVKIELYNQVLYATTRLNAIQMGIFYHLNIPFPPNFIYKSVSDKVDIKAKINDYLYSNELDDDIELTNLQPAYLQESKFYFKQ